MHHTVSLRRRGRLPLPTHRAHCARRPQDTLATNSTSSFEYGTCTLANGGVVYLDDDDNTERYVSGDVINITIQTDATDPDATADPPPTYTLGGNKKAHIVFHHAKIASAKEANAARRAQYGVSLVAGDAVQEMDVLMIRLKYTDREPSYGTEASTLEELVRQPADTGYSSTFQGSLGHMVKLGELHAIPTRFEPSPFRPCRLVWGPPPLRASRGGRGCDIPLIAVPSTPESYGCLERTPL